ncbi:hypothetical protein IAR50_006221 [Cryptococcus sp. DSM 104548]
MSQMLKLPDTPHPHFLISNPRGLQSESLSPSTHSSASTIKIPRCLTPYPTRQSYSPISSPLTGVSGLSSSSPGAFRSSSPLSAAGSTFESGDGEEQDEEQDSLESGSSTIREASSPIPILHPSQLPATLRMSKLSSLSPSFSPSSSRRLPLSPVPPRMKMKRRTTLTSYSPTQAIDFRTGRPVGTAATEKSGEKGRDRERRPEPLTLPKLGQHRVRILTPYPSPSLATPSPTWSSSAVSQLPSNSPMSHLFADDYADVISPAGGPASLSHGTTDSGLGIVRSMSNVDLRMRGEEVHTIRALKTPGTGSHSGMLTASFETPRVVVSGAGEWGVAHID